MTRDRDEGIVRGTGNIFADLGYADAGTHLLKAGLANRIQTITRDSGLTQAAAAKLMGLSQPDVSRILKGQFRDVSVERFIRLLTRLGCDVDIVVRAPGEAANEGGAIHLPAAIRA